MPAQSIEDFFENEADWSEEMGLLRKLSLSCGLTEAFKWRVPCYTYKNKNILLIHGFKHYVAISFFKGALLRDEKNLLIQATENEQSGRQFRFTSVREIKKIEETLRAYIFEAIELEKLGKKVQHKDTNEFHVPPELTQKFTEDTEFKKAFNALTPGRQRGYLLNFAQPKQSKTRLARIEKYYKRIFDGKGVHDCVCGLSKNMPRCDGSHNKKKQSFK